jgi:arabinose-5-phosphate isomerase
VVSNNSLKGIITDGDLRRHMGPEMLNSKVESIMTKNPQTVNAKILVSDALNLINNLGIQGLFVTNKDMTPIGFVHFHDLIRIIKG